MAKIRSIRKIEPDTPVAVYDIEVEDKHVFYANGILVHNTDSIFTMYGDALKSIYGSSYNDVSNKDKIDKVIELNESVAQYINRTMIPDILNRHNASPDLSVARKFNFNFKQELVIRKALFFETKKRYAIWVVSREGEPIDKVTISGIEAVRADYSQFTRQMLGDFIDCILKTDIDRCDIANKIDEYVSKYRSLLDDGDIKAAIPGSYNKENYASTPRSLKAMLIYNAIYGETFKVLDRGYRFDLEPINMGIFDDDIQRRLQKLIDDGRMGKDGKLDCIMIPYGQKLDTEVFHIDYTKMIDSAVLSRLEDISELYGINVHDTGDLGWE